MNATYLSFALFAVIVVQSVIHHIERRDLYKRIMCNDIYDYMSEKKTTIKQPISRHREVLNRWHKGGVKE